MDALELSGAHWNDTYVEVAAGSLYEAAALVVAEFRQSGFVHSEPGAASRLVVTVEAPTTTHELPLRKL